MTDQTIWKCIQDVSLSLWFFWISMTNQITWICIKRVSPSLFSPQNLYDQWCNLTIYPVCEISSQCSYFHADLTHFLSLLYFSLSIAINLKGSWVPNSIWVPNSMLVIFILKPAWQLIDLRDPHSLFLLVCFVPFWYSFYSYHSTSFPILCSHSYLPWELLLAPVKHCHIHWFLPGGIQIIYQCWDQCEGGDQP